MKINSILCALMLLIASVSSINARCALVRANFFTSKEKKTSVIETCEAVIDDNTNNINITFFETIRDVTITITNEAGLVVYSESVNAMSGQTYYMQSSEIFQDDQEYYLNISNGKQYLLADFPVE